MQPHILFPILIFAFGMGAFLTTFLDDINQDFSKKDLVTKQTILKASKPENVLSTYSASSENKSWIDKFKKNLVNNYYYPVTEVSIKIPLKGVSKIKYYILETEFLEPYQNFCVNQVLEKFPTVRYKIIENNDKIKFKIYSQNKKSLEQFKKELNISDIKADFLSINKK